MDKKITKLLEDIRQLMVLQLVMNGATSEDIASVLKIDSSTVRHMISVRKLRKNSR